MWKGEFDDHEFDEPWEDIEDWHGSGHTTDEF
jgi:hypothetical protein